jgi:cell division protein DivIC
MVICLKSKRGKKPRTGLGLVALMVLSICGIVTVKKLDLNHEQAVAKARINELEDTLEKVKEEKKELEDREDYMQTREFIEDMAREKLGLIYEDEIIFKSNEE